MVSKVAVIALVAVIAVPILLGYAFNLEETTETEWKTTGESVNVTQLLQNNVTYTYAHGNIYQLNSFNMRNAGTSSMQPLYESYTKTATSLYSRIFINTGVPGSNYDLWDYYWLFLNVHTSTTSQYMRANLYYVDSSNNEHLYMSINNVLALSYIDADKTVKIEYYNGGQYQSYISYTNDQIRIKFDWVNGFDGNAQGKMWGYPKADNLNNFTGYVDFSRGWRLFNHNQQIPYPAGTNYVNSNGIIFPNPVKSYLLTIDLESITDSTYSMRFAGSILLEKTTTAGIISWTATDIDSSETWNLYYDQTSGNNTYQIYVYTDPTGTPINLPGYYTYIRHFEFRYVGAWPDIIGEANYYNVFDVQHEIVANSDPTMDFVGIINTPTTPVMRIDDAVLRAFETPIIEDQTYDPASFKTNPVTTINNPTIYGSTIEFGGNVYTVKNGNITMGSHQVPVKGLQLKSVANGSGTYDNMIGNTTVSTTATPSTIKFTGKWEASITTQSLESQTVTKTEWKAGEFAWNGIDHNFLLCGMITCIAAFIGCGIYAKKTGSGGIIPVMIVCGGAALMFFLML